MFLLLRLWEDLYQQQFSFTVGIALAAMLGIRDKGCYNGLCRIPLGRGGGGFAFCAAFATAPRGGVCSFSEVAPSLCVVLQDAWRRCQTPASINLAELGEEEWEVIRDTEDEQVWPRQQGGLPTFRSCSSCLVFGGRGHDWSLQGGGISGPPRKVDLFLRSTLPRLHSECTTRNSPPPPSLPPTRTLTNRIYLGSTGPGTFEFFTPQRRTSPACGRYSGAHVS